MQTPDSTSSAETPANEVLRNEVSELYVNINTQDKNLPDILKILNASVHEEHHDLVFKIIDEISDLHRRMMDEESMTLGVLTVRDFSKSIVEKMNVFLATIQEVKKKENSEDEKFNQLVNDIKEDIKDYQKLASASEQLINDDINALRKSQEENYAIINQIIILNELGTAKYPQQYEDFRNACTELLKNSIKLKNLEDPQEFSEEEQLKYNSVVKAYPEVMHKLIDLGLAEYSAQAINLAGKVRTGETSYNDFQNAESLYQNFHTLVNYIDIANMSNTEKFDEKLSSKNINDMAGMREVVKYIQGVSLLNNATVFNTLAQEAIANNQITQEELDNLILKHQTVSSQLSDFKDKFGDNETIHAIKVSIDSEREQLSQLPLQVRQHDNLNDTQQNEAQFSEEQSLSGDIRAFVENLCKNTHLNDNQKKNMIKELIDDLAADKNQFGEALDVLNQMRSELNIELETKKADLSPLFQKQKAIYSIMTSINNEVAQLKQQNIPIELNDQPRRMSRP